MEIRIGDRIYQVADDCPVDSPKRATLIRHLREHGPESLLTSKKTAPFAACVFDRLTESGAQLVEPVEHVTTTEDSNLANAPDGESSSD